MIAQCRLVYPVGLSANAVTATIARQEAKTGPHALLPAQQAAHGQGPNKTSPGTPAVR